MRTLALGLIAGGTAMLAGIDFNATANAQLTRAKDVDKEAVPEVLDEIVFQDGRTFRGRVLEETDTQVRFELHRPGFPVAITTYSKSQILSISRGKVEATSSVVGGVPDLKKNKATDEVKSLPEDLVKIYKVDMEGLFGWDQTASDDPVTFWPESLGMLFDDVDSTFDDLIATKNAAGEQIWIVDPAKRDTNIVLIEYDCTTPWYAGFDGVWTTEDIGPIFEDEVDKGRRIIFWVKNAMDGGAFLPFVTPEPNLVFHPDAIMGFTSDLNNFDIGDDVVDEKQISLRLGHAEGFVIDGGYAKVAKPVVYSMARSKYWLAMRIVDGEPELRFSTSQVGGDGWRLLSDGGGAYHDSGPNSLAPDQLALDASTANMLGISSTPSAGIRELMSNLGFSDYHVLEETEGTEQLEERSEEFW
ncbi:MAG: hypothetical protein AAGB34_02180, partial [Planctomycetota bacterium]